MDTRGVEGWDARMHEWILHSTFSGVLPALFEIRTFTTTNFLCIFDHK